MANLFVAAQVENLAEIRRFVREEAQALGAEEEAICDLELAVDEAACNIVCHGYEDRSGTIQVAVERHGDRLIVRLRDQALAFDPCAPAARCDAAAGGATAWRPGHLFDPAVVDEMLYRVPPEAATS